MNRPAFKPHFVPVPVPPAAVALLSETGRYILEGEPYYLLAPLLDGSLTTPQIVRRLHGQLSLAKVYQTIKTLTDKGYVHDHRDDFPRSQAAFHTASGNDLAATAGRRADARTRLTTCGEIDPDEVRPALAAAGVAVDPDAPFRLVVADNYLDPAISVVNAAALAERTPWMLARPVGLEAWVGPLFVPGETGCWACLAQRLRANAGWEEFFSGPPGSAIPQIRTAFASLPGTRATGCQLAVHEAARWLADGRNERLWGRVVSLDFATLQTAAHVLVRQPECPACGSRPTPDRDPAPVEVVPCRKTFTAEGGHRAITPTTMLAAYRHHVSRVTGVVKFMERIGETESGAAYTYRGVNVISTPGVGAGEPFSDCFGKGKSDVQSQASCLGEALERYSGVYRGHEPRRRGSLNRLGAAAIDPNACQLFSDRQFAGEHDSRHEPVPFRLDPDAVLDWAPLWSLTRREFVYLPMPYCYFGVPEERPCAYANSNGCAAGHTREEAILQGFLELVERDSVGIWWYNGVRRPGVELESFDDPYAAQVRDQYRRTGRRMWVLDLTADLGVPAFAALSQPTEPAANDGLDTVLAGFAAHFDARIALSRAITELNQAHGWGEQHAREMNLGFARFRLSDYPHLSPDPTRPARRLSDFPVHSTEDLRDDILLGQSLVERAGLELHVLDQTRPDIGLNVVRVVVPGLRHFYGRYAPGRLYDVPLKLGWRDEPSTEDEVAKLPVRF